MKYTVVHSSEWTYPDAWEYQSASDKIVLHSPRASFATVQLLFTGLPGCCGDAGAAGGGDSAAADCKFSIKASGGIADLPLAAYELVPVHVEDNPFLEKGVVVNGCPSRWAPFDIYDCIKPLDAAGAAPEPVNGAVGLYLSFEVARGASPGRRTGSVDIECCGKELSVPAEITVYKAEVPEEERLKFINFYVSRLTAQYHGVEKGSAENLRLDGEYHKMLRRMRQNTYIADDVDMSEDGDGNYTFDFSGLEKSFENMLALGFKYIMLPYIGGRESWHKSTILIGPKHIQAMSYEGYVYLKQYLGALVPFLKSKGWLDRALQGVADEPNEHNAIEYRALCGTIRKLAPELRLLDAVSYVPVHGALDIWIPLNSEYDEHRKEYESFRGKGDELWHYVCCGPRKEGYINRFMDYPLLATRYLFWGNYKYNLSGYLHWASNHYQPGQDPFKQNCPKHVNTDNSTILPAGDTHLIYPGDGAPWMSMRLEAQRNSAEDYELLLALAAADKPKADAICEKCFKSFKNVEYDVAKFEAAKIELLEAVSAL